MPPSRSLVSEVAACAFTKRSERIRRGTSGRAICATPGSGSDETREVDLHSDSAVVGHTVSELNFPEGVTILLVNRGKQFLIPKGSTRLEAGDTLLLFGNSAKLRYVERELEQRVKN